MSTMSYVYSTRCLHRVFTNSFVFLAGIYLLGVANCAKIAFSRNEDGDRFTNPFYTNGINCTSMNAHCDQDLLKQCRECTCNKDTETYRADIGQCVSKENLKNLTGCTYKGWKYDSSLKLVITDTNLPTLNFKESGSVNIHGERIFPNVDAADTTCDIKNSTSFLNRYGKWVTLPKISDVLVLRVYNRGPVFPRHMALTWENVADIYHGLLIKLTFSCQTSADSPMNGCFVFKSKGSNTKLDTTKSTVETRKTGPTVSTIKATKIRSTILPTTETSSTAEVKKRNDNAFSVSFPVIIGVSAGVGLVILIIIILAVCFVRHKTKKHKDAAPTTSNVEAPPTVQFTAQTRFSLIKEAVPVDSEDENYTSLQEDRESYDPYCPLQKDDVDLNVIDTILKDAISMESMKQPLEPRYSCHLTKDDKIVIESVKPRPPKQPKYFELEAPDNANEPDYEEVDDEDNTMPSSRLLDRKPPLPEREYVERKPKLQRLHSEC